MLMFCPTCGKQFEGKSRDRYCSGVCKTEMQKQKRKEQYRENKSEKTSKYCGFCGSEFTPKGRNDTVYCSIKCQVDAKAKRKNIELSERSCVVCGKVFMPAQNKQICCSGECVRKRYYENNKEKRKQQSKEWRKNNIERVRENERRKREQNKERYKLNDQYYHDQTRFGGQKLPTLQRDKYKCVICGSANDLVVHHIDQSGSSETPNNHPTNLVTLCSSCHTKQHNPRLNTTPHLITTCLVCGQEIRVSQVRADDGRGKYCSKKCADKSKGVKVPMECQHCGKTFDVLPSRIKRGKVKYCSMECRKAAGYAWTNK